MAPERAAAIRSRNPSPTVEGPKPEVASATVAIGAGQRPAGELDPHPAKRLRREGDGLRAHQRQLGELGPAGRQQVDHHPGGEPGRPDAEPGVAGGRDHPAVGGPVEEGAEAGAGVDGTGPRVGEPHAVELREGLKEEVSEGREGGRPLLEGGAQAVAEVVDGVVAAEEDAVVGAQPVVEELVAGAAHALPVAAIRWHAVARG